MKTIISFIIILYTIGCNSQNTNQTINSNDSSQNIVTIESVVEIIPQSVAKYKNIKAIPIPSGFKRIEAKEFSYAEYLRNLPLKTENNDVLLYNGDKKGNQTAQFAVLTIDVGTRDLQQCADAVMRLRAEYLFKQKQYSNIHFNFLSDGKPRYYTEYSKGDRSYAKYRKYMNYIFSYANTGSLKNELKQVSNINNMQIGDVFIQKGRPYGHAITVMDMAINEKGEKIFMLSQSYMPAQDIHILNNPSNKNISPWYKINSTAQVYTPEWTFNWNDLKRF